LLLDVKIPNPVSDNEDEIFMTGNISELEKAMAKVTSELRDGLKHGFFDYRLRGEIVKGRKRQLVLEAGKKYKFTILEEELDQRP
jgi:hypothetical protein